MPDTSFHTKHCRCSVNVMRIRRHPYFSNPQTRFYTLTLHHTFHNHTCEDSSTLWTLLRQCQIFEVLFPNSFWICVSKFPCSIFLVYKFYSYTIFTLNSMFKEDFSRKLLLNLLRRPLPLRCIIGRPAHRTSVLRLVLSGTTACGVILYPPMRPTL